LSSLIHYKISLLHPQVDSLLECWTTQMAKKWPSKLGLRTKDGNHHWQLAENERFVRTVLEPVKAEPADLQVAAACFPERQSSIVAFVQH